MIGSSSIRIETKCTVTPAIFTLLSNVCGPGKLSSHEGVKVDDHIFEPPHEVGRENFHEPCSTTKLIACASSRRSVCCSPDAGKRQFEFLGEWCEDGAMAQDELRVGLDFASIGRAPERFEVVRFPDGHDGETRTALRSEAPEFDFHAGLPCQFVQPGRHSGGMAIACKP